MGWSVRARAARQLGAIAAVACLAGAPLPGRAEAGTACPGDCGGDGAVSIADLIMAVSIALEAQPLGACAAIDLDGDEAVTVNELISAVAAALGGCAPAPTATAALTPATETAAVETATPGPTDATPGPATTTPSPVPTGVAEFCDLPGSVQYTMPGVSVVPGGPEDAPDLTWLNLPAGFCAHFYANVGNVRQLRFAPGGELFVASPTRQTTSNGRNGRAAIVVLPDDDKDGTADTVLTFKNQLPETVGLLFAGGYLYYQDKTRILRLPYAPGDRLPASEAEEVANLVGDYYVSNLHWPKTIDISDGGVIYVTNGGDEVMIPPSPTPAPCDSRPNEGRILKLDGNPAGTTVARGFRNPISLRCVRGRNICFAIELTRDYSTPRGGREKLIPVREGDDWGHPCCATQDTPFDDTAGQADCSGVAKEIDSFFVGNTPFDLDYELGRWPDPWGNRAYVATHGAYQDWQGARLVGIEMDRMTGTVLPGSDLTGMSDGAMRDFATGWHRRFMERGRPTVVAFAPDGRLFLGNDTNGDIIWIAPFGLTP